MIKSKFYILIAFVLLTSVTLAQCPINIGFDNGDFTNWSGYTGKIDRSGVLSFPNSGIVAGRHEIVFRKDNRFDPYGGFPVASPNGSSACVKLGNSNTGSEAERLTYTFKVPDNVSEYSLIYYYAVVFQNPNHASFQQPRFTAKVFDVDLNKYADCGSFDFQATSNLPGFKLSTVGRDVFYKPWSPVTINLINYAGKTIRLEFTTNDCALGGHFGYAYIDINQNCKSPIAGNVICPDLNSITLTAPSGFKEYYWYNGQDFSNILSTNNSYSVSPKPPIGTKYSVRIVPFPGIGCEDTISTTIKSAEKLALHIVDSISECKNIGVDLTAPAVTLGTDSGFTYNYYTDSQTTNFILDPKNINKNGTYYIQAITPGGCIYTTPVKVMLFDSPQLVITNPAAVCKPAIVNIKAPAITAGSISANNLTYWNDESATKILLHPDSIKNSGTYYIKAINGIKCSAIKPVTVLINELPLLIINNPSGCNSVDLTLQSVTNGSDQGLKLSYWMDDKATISLVNPQTVTKNGQYYIMASNAAGCVVTVPVSVNVYSYPKLAITNPPPVTFPDTVDITHSYIVENGTVYSYYRDSLATIELKNPDKIKNRGTYYIKAVNGNSCSLIAPVKVTINKPPDVDFNINVFTPNGDGKNDVFAIKTPIAMHLKYLRIFNSYGKLLFETQDSNKGWDGTSGGKKLPVGTYYWIFEGYDTYAKQIVKKAGSISIVL